MNSIHYCIHVSYQRAPSDEKDDMVDIVASVRTPSRVCRRSAMGLPGLLIMSRISSSISRDTLAVDTRPARSLRSFKVAQHQSATVSVVLPLTATSNNVTRTYVDRDTQLGILSVIDVPQVSYPNLSDVGMQVQHRRFAPEKSLVKLIVQYGHAHGVTSTSSVVHPRLLPQ